VDAEVDIHHLDGLLPQALASEFLAGFHVSSEVFEEWLARQRQQFVEQGSVLLFGLASRQISEGELEAALDTGRKMVALDPLFEPGYRVLMLAFEGAGRRAEAARAYRICEQTLKRDLGVVPDPETQRLAVQLGITPPSAEPKSILQPTERCDTKPGGERGPRVFRQKGGSEALSVGMQLRDFLRSDRRKIPRRLLEDARDALLHAGDLLEEPHLLEKPHEVMPALALTDAA
jgi:hypothetical protein